MRKFFTQLAAWLPSLLMLAPILARADLPAGNAINVADVTNIVASLAQFLIVISMVIAVICIVLGGIMVMTAQADPGRFKTGIAWVKNVAIGAAVVLGSGVIINTVASLIDRSFFCQLSVLGVCLY